MWPHSFLPLMEELPVIFVYMEHATHTFYCYCLLHDKLLCPWVPFHPEDILTEATAELTFAWPDTKAEDQPPCSDPSPSSM